MKNLALFLILLFGVPCFLGAQVVDTAAVEREVDSLIALNRKLIEQRKMDQALIIIKKSEALAQLVLGRDHSLYVGCLFNHGRTLTHMRRNAEAEPIYLEAKKIGEIVLGKEHPEYAWILNNLGVLYKDLGEYTSAEGLLQEAKSIRQKVLGIDHPDFAGSLNNIAILYWKMGDYDKAEPFFLEAKERRAKIFGKQHPEYFASVSNLSVLYMDKGDYAKAEPLYLEAKDIKEAILNKESPEYASILNNLAVFYHTKGDYAIAEPLYIKSKEIRLKTLGANSSDYAYSINNLATLYYNQGDLEKAELAYLEGIENKASTLGTTHPDYAASLNNLANLYTSKGYLQKAKLHYLECKNIYDHTTGKKSINYIRTLYGLGNLSLLQGDYLNAEALFLEALEGRETALGKTHPDYASSLNSLGSLYQILGEYSKAESLYLEATEIREKTQGKRHPDYANTLNNFAMLYFLMGDLRKAEKLVLEANEIFTESLGKKHPNYVDVLFSLTSLYQAKNQISKSVEFLLEMNGSIRYLIEQSAKYSSESQMLAYIQKFQKNSAHYYSFSQTNSSPELVRTGFDNALFYNGLLLENSRRLAWIVAEADSTTRKIYARWQGCRRRLANEYAKAIAERKYVADIEAESETYEKELARNLPVWGSIYGATFWQEVQQQLRPTEAAVELVSYRYYTPHPTDSTMYAALVLLPTDTAPHFIPLFEERQLQTLFNRPGYDEQGIVKGLYAPNSELLHLLWKPLEPLLRDVKTIYYSPAGLLHRINPAALRDADKQYLSEGRQWVRVGSTRELVTGRLADHSYALDPTASPTAAVWGGIRYDMDSTAFAAVNPLDPDAEPLPEYQRKDGKFRYMAEEGLPTRPTGLRGGGGGGDDGWEPLPASAHEVEQVDTLLQKSGFRTEVLTGYTATEERIKSIGKTSPSPRILHVATHGFAYPDPKKEPQQSFIGQEPVYKLQDDPMLRSGLILAGANHYWTNKRPLENREDGVLVAYEVRDLDLRNTELAVLSACQTGLGDVVGSEGVYGLQRAFRIAGAKFLIVSLWEVPDEQTRELMRLFYENWVTKGESLRDAFDHAQAELRERESNPYMWAGFVLVE